MFPANNVWNTPIDYLPIHPKSDTYVATVGANTRLHGDFGSGYWFNGVPFGLPFAVVPGTQPKVPVTFTYWTDSDPGPYPIPPDVGVQADLDRHVIVLDKDNCILYEMWEAVKNPDGSWHAGSGAKFDMRSNALRPLTWTSANAAGLPFLPGLVRYDEVMSGEIKHAIGMTVNYTSNAFLWPARHKTVLNVSDNFPPMGARFRLKASVDISGFHPQVQVLLRALKKYGAFVNDNGGPWFLSGALDTRWDDQIWATLHNLRGADFEMVDESSLMADPDSGAVKGMATPTAPVSVSVAPGGTTLAAGQGVQLSASVTGTSNTAVAWSVSPAGAGSVTPGGWYSAPSGITSVATAVVTATSLADSSKSSSATITVNPVIAISISPASVTLTNGQTQQFTATVSGSTAGSTCSVVSGPGTISTSGLYAAPGAIASAQTASINCVARGDASKSANAQVSLVPGGGPLSLSSVSLNASAAPGGGTVVGAVNLSGPASAESVAALISSNPAVAAVPLRVVIPPGASSAAFTITTSPVASATPVTITAVFARRNANVVLTVNPAGVTSSGPPILWMELSTPGIYGSDTAYIVFCLAQPAPTGGAVVSISSSDPRIASVPATVTVAEGMIVGVAAVPTSRVTEVKTVTLTIRSGGSTRSLPLSVNPSY